MSCMAQGQGQCEVTQNDGRPHRCMFAVEIAMGGDKGDDGADVNMHALSVKTHKVMQILGGQKE